MDDHERQRQLSLIPYSYEPGEIVLRHGNAVVVFDPRSQELSLRDTNHDDHEQLDNCPFCHRPLRESQNGYHATKDTRSTSPEHGFVDPKYFRMLANSTPGSRDSSIPSTPKRSLRSLRSGGSRNLSGPPTGAEFVDSQPAGQPAGSGIQGSSFSPGYFKRFFVEERTLGQGGRGVVLLVKHVLDGVFLGQFACKRIPVGNDHSWLEKVLVEVQLLQSLDHPNLVSYRHVWLEDAQITNFGPSVPCVFILQQYCNAGDLQGHVHRFKSDEASSKEQLKQRHRRKSSNQQDTPNIGNAVRHMPLDEIFSFFKDITAGLHHLHANKYIHRDLKPSNCLLHRNAQGKVIVHVSDFGEVQSASAVRTSTGATGTISYCAPEVLRRESTSQSFGNFTTKSDIFSLGLILYFMCFSTLPFQNASATESGEDMDSLRAEITSWPGINDSKKPRDDLPEQLYRFLKRLLSLNPDERPSTEEILQSIARGASGVDEATRSTNPPLTPTRDEIHPRFSQVDSPAPEKTQLRKRSSFSRPNFLLRHTSDDASPRNRSPRSHDEKDTSAILSTRTVLTPPTDSARALSPKSPRLMLPPPEPSRLSSWKVRMALLVHDPVVLRTTRALVFLLKVSVLLGLCAPYTPMPWALYALFAVAVVDIIVPDLSLWTSGGLLVGHLVIVWWLKSTAILCARPSFQGWERK